MSEKEILCKDLEDFNNNKVWVTKKIRMDASERMEKKNIQINYFLIYYSACLAIMSFLMVYEPKGFNLSLFSSMIALALPSANIFQYKAEYSKKSEEYRNCYLALSELENEIKTCLFSEEKVSASKSNEYKMKYEKILQKYINHSKIDYLLFKKENKNNNGLSSKEKFYLVKIKWSNYILSFLLAIAPVVLIYLKLKGIVMFTN